ncbi:hypothetical protein [Siphonobacter curvatus]|uniref:Glycosyltransferase RgtA/B/C/D-like domain-containing protein n=1 Tax=Siphonobacter curvatus TaxID=2094562 RepID=A0A2S7IJB0_9BACT|nr:hypothetical protein [Siphonobacter curvatus]PQA56723.1 hypothetical protein C5O19_15370 [Siphonobacter curvatus]
MSSSRANYALFFTYTVFVIVSLWQHEMWRDELQAWGIVASTANPFDLAVNARYEGHPLLWFVLLWPLAQLFDHPNVMQVLHGALALGSAYLIIFKSPFRFLEKILILFSYYFIYEYVTISRNYQIGVLIICGICVLWRNPQKNLLAISGLLFLLLQTNVFAFLVGLGLAVGLLAEEVYARRIWPLRSKSLLAALVILAGVMGTAQSLPPADSGFLTQWTSRFDSGTFLFAAAGVAHGFLPLSSFSEYHYWNFSLFPFGLGVKLALGLVLAVLAIFSKPKSSVALIILVASVFFIFIFTYEKPRGLFRHFGHYTLALIAAYWIDGYKQSSRPVFTLGYFGVGILLLQVLAGMNAWYRDLRYPFSQAEAMALYLQKTYPACTPVAGVFQDYMIPLEWFLGRSIYCLDVQQERPYVLWSKSHWNDTLNNQPDSLTYQRFITYQQSHPESVLVMTYHTSNHPEVGQQDTLRSAEGTYVFTCLKKFDGSITSEDYYLFNTRKVDSR